MGKYLLRFRNLRREKDILKLACYCFILWLKMGLFEKEEGEHDEDVGLVGSSEEKPKNDIPF